jgi:phenylacetate-coenzyme A ligase PaaK-like adenylate-forming protein
VVQLVQSNGKQQVKPPKENRPLKIKAKSFELVVTCRDSSGNTGQATVVPVFPPDDDDDEEDDDD